MHVRPSRRTHLQVKALSSSNTIMGGDPQPAAKRETRSKVKEAVSTEEQAMEMVNEEIMTLYELLERQGVS